MLLASGVGPGNDQNIRTRENKLFCEWRWLLDFPMRDQKSECRKAISAQWFCIPGTHQPDSKHEEHEHAIVLTDVLGLKRISAVLSKCYRG